MTDSPTSANPAPTPAHSRKNPFLAELLSNELLTKPGSEKETRHFVFSLAGSGLTYTPGDSLAVFARNSPALVEEVISLLGFDPKAPVDDGQGRPTTFGRALLHNFILNRANKKIMTGLAERIPQGEQRNQLMEIVNNDDVLGAYIHTRDYVDVLREFNEAEFSGPSDFLLQLSPIPPRLYSIASCLPTHLDEAQLCISIVRYETHGRKKAGLATGFLADHARLRVRDIPVYVQESKSFRLPRDGATDIIMVGPGTGIAPFRAFLEQRMLDGATGRNWLIFGEQHRATDFLYVGSPGTELEFAL